MEDVTVMICFATKAVATVAAASQLAGEDDTAVLHIPMVVMIWFATEAAVAVAAADVGVASVRGTTDAAGAARATGMICFFNDR